MGDADQDKELKKHCEKIGCRFTAQVKAMRVEVRCWAEQHDEPGNSGSASPQASISGCADIVPDQPSSSRHPRSSTAAMMR